MYDDLITNARELCDAAKSAKERGNALDSAAMSWAITNNCVPQLCDALVAMTARAEKAEADSKGLVRILPYSVLAYKIYTKRNRHGNIHKRIVECVNYGFPESEIGKTVFLTREAAEAALKAGDKS